MRVAGMQDTDSNKEKVLLYGSSNEGLSKEEETDTARCALCGKVLMDNEFSLCDQCCFGDE